MYNENTQEQNKERKIITDEEAEGKSLKKIMVGNLPHSIKREELRELVDSFGRVISCEVINQKGYGFVTFLDHKDAAFAIYRLKDKLFQNNKLRADWSEEKPRPNARKRKEEVKVKRVKKVPGSLRYLTPQNPATEQQFTNGAGGVYVPKIQQQQQQQQQNYSPPPSQSSPLSLSQPPTLEDTPVENVGGDHQNEGGRRNYGNNRRSHPRGNYNNYDYNNNNNYVNNNFNNNSAPNYGNNNAGNYEDQDDQWTGQGNQRNQAYDQRTNQQRARGSRGGRRGGRGRRNRGGRGQINDHQLYTGNDQIPENNNNNNDTLPPGGTVEEVVSNAPVAGLVPPPSVNVPQNTSPQNNYGRQKGGHKQQQQQKSEKQQNVNPGGEVGDFVITVANTKTEEVMFKVRLGDEQIEGLLAALQPFIPK